MGKRRKKTSKTLYIKAYPPDQMRVVNHTADLKTRPPDTEGKLGSKVEVQQTGEFANPMEHDRKSKTPDIDERLTY